MRLNIQPIEKQSLLPKDGMLDVHSIFYTIQGEGPFCGYPAVFIRLAGCNLQCPFCDTNYTSDREPKTVLETVALVRNAHVYTTKHPFTLPEKSPLVVITGGEPFRQNIAPLVRHLVAAGYRVQIETNGTLHVEDLPWDSITVVCSPKTGKVHPRLIPHIDAWKYVLSHDSIAEDGLPILALDHTASPMIARPPEGNTKPIYLQPMDAQDGDINVMNRIACITSCMRYGYILQLQIHKLLGLE